jgi:hypothetical protein
MWEYVWPPSFRLGWCFARRGVEGRGRDPWVFQPSRWFFFFFSFLFFFIFTFLTSFSISFPFFFFFKLFDYFYFFIFLLLAGVNFTNCVVGGGYGGAIFIGRSIHLPGIIPRVGNLPTLVPEITNIVFTNVRFTKCKGFNGGGAVVLELDGISFVYGRAVSVNVSVLNCVFEGNEVCTSWFIYVFVV